MACVKLVVYGAAQPAGSKTVGYAKGGKAFVRDAAGGSAAWKRAVADVAGRTMDGAELLDGPLALSLTFYRTRPKGHYGSRGLRSSAPVWPTVRPDLTKLIRAVEDACTGIVWRDDAQIVTQEAHKEYGEPARVEVWVREQ